MDKGSIGDTLQTQEKREILLHKNSYFHTGEKCREVWKGGLLCSSLDFSQSRKKSGTGRSESWLSQSPDRQETPVTEVKLG